MDYTIPVAVEGGGAPADEFNALRAAVLDMAKYVSPLQMIDNRPYAGAGVNYYKPPFVNRDGGTGNTLQIYFESFVFTAPCDVRALGVNRNGNDGAASQLLVGLYADNNGRPGGTPLWMSSPVDAQNGGQYWQSIGAGVVPLAAGVPIWAAVNWQRVSGGELSQATVASGTVFQTSYGTDSNASIDYLGNGSNSQMWRGTLGSPLSTTLPDISALSALVPSAGCAHVSLGTATP